MEAHNDMNPKNIDDIEKMEQHTEQDSSTESDSSIKIKRSKKLSKKEEKGLSNELEAVRLQYEELNDKYLRLFSEFDNFRKRTLKEKIELSKTASEDIITVLLPVIDDFERALQAAEASEETKQQFEGVALIYSKLKKSLQQKGLEEVEAQGLAFDTDYHEAMSQIPAQHEEQKGKVIDVIEKGYSLNGKIIRFAKVIVAV